MSETLRLGTSSRRLDRTAVLQGRAKECPYRPGLMVHILPGATYNPRFRRAIQDQAIGLAVQGGDKEEVGRQLASHYTDPEFVVEALVADIEGLYNAKGNPVKYTRERGLAIFGDEANADVLQWVVNEALDYGQYYIDTVESEAGN